jgi:short-subunit dehydrogenase
MTTLSGRTALVTGASSGLGIDFARDLAARGANLILVARRQAAMETLAAELRQKHGVSVTVTAADLGDAAAREALCQSLPQPADILVNNAGFGLFGDFAASDWEQVNQMLQLDIVAVTHLTHLLLSAMRARNSGHILLVGSTGSYQPSPGYAAYAAAKAYVLSFGVALNHELKGSGVSCTTLCPGITRTSFHDVAGQKAGMFYRATVMEPAKVAAIGIDAMLAGRSSVIAGPLNAAVAHSTRLLPRTLQAAIASRAMRM